MDSGSQHLLVMLRTLTAGLPGGTRWVAPWREPTVETHERVLVALCARDGDTAAEPRRSHMFQTADLAVDHLRAYGYWDMPTPNGAPGGAPRQPGCTAWLVRVFPRECFGVGWVVNGNVGLRACGGRRSASFS